jgi:hypothetical protein
VEAMRELLAFIVELDALTALKKLLPAVQKPRFPSTAQAKKVCTRFTAEIIVQME